MTMLELVMKYGTGSTIRDKITTALPHIFNFDFPMYDNTYKSVLEAKIVKHYLEYELCNVDDTMWQLILDTWLNENMPLYNQRYETTLINIRPLVNQSLSTQKSGSSQRFEQGTNNSTVTTADLSNATTNTENDRAHGTTRQNEHNDNRTHSDNKTVKELDTPNGSIQSLEDGYLSKGVKEAVSGGDATRGKSNDTETGEEHNIGESSTSTSSNGSTTSTGGNSGQATTTDEWLDSVLGHAGISESKLLQEYRDILIDIDKEIVTAIKPLFKLVF